MSSEPSDNDWSNLVEAIERILRSEAVEPSQEALLECRAALQGRLKGLVSINLEEVVGTLKILENPTVDLPENGSPLALDLELVLLHNHGELLTYLQSIPPASLDAGHRLGLLIACGANFFRRPLTWKQEFVKSINETITKIKLKQLLRPVPPKRKKEKSSPTWTRSQQAAYDRMLALAELHYAQEPISLGFGIRTFPLIIGPTGCGKSTLARSIAKSLGAHLISGTAGEWIPKGARGYEGTIEAIVLACVKHPKVVLFVDELDKWRGETSDTWGRSILNDIFAVLDLNIGWPHVSEEGRQSFTLPAGVTNPESELPELIRSRLWIIGAGTWQDQHRDAKRGNMGFGRSDQESVRIADTAAELKGVPQELLARFSQSLIHLDYPGRGEIAEIVKRSGLEELATNLGIQIDLRTVDPQQNGMRCLELLATELLLQKRRAAPHLELAGKL